MSEGPISFSILFKEYRKRTRLTSLDRFGDALADTGLVFDNSTFSNWQRGTRIPRDRRTLIGILRTLYRHHGIRSPQEANVLLEAAGSGYLSPKEQDLVFSNTH